MKTQTWWNNNAQNQYNTFRNWVGDSTAQSKVYMANYLKDKKYQSLVDLGCADATFYNTLQSHDINMKYTGVDSCAFFVKMLQDKNIPVIDSDIRSISSLSDKSIDCVFSRHTMEHQSSYRELLSEMIRIANCEACHIFFIKPADKEEIKYAASSDLYHNHYRKSDIEKTLSENPKVKNWEWNNINKDEVALHIYIK